MGVAGVALIFGVISFFKMIASLGRLNAWKKMGVSCRAVVTGIAGQVDNYKGKKGVTLYQYTMNVDFRGSQVQTVYEETVGPNATPKYAPGSQTMLLYNPASKGCRNMEDLKGEVKSNAVSLAVSVAIFFGCFLLLGLLGG